MQNGIGLLPNCLVKKKKNFVLQPCNCIARERAGKKINCIGIVLQEKGVVGLVCIARGELYCKRMHVAGKLYCNMVVQWAKIVLQYMDCIARVCSGMEELYCNMVGLKCCFFFFCIAIHLVYCG